MATDNFQTLSDIPGAPSRAPFAVTPSDSVELSIIPKALYVGTGGTVILRGVGGAADVTFKNVANGPGARRARAICPRNRHHRRRHRGARLMSMFGFTTRRAAMRRRGGAGSGPVAGTSPTAFAVAPTVQYHPNSQTATLNGSNLVLDCADLKGLAPLTRPCRHSQQQDTQSQHGGRCDRYAGNSAEQLGLRDQHHRTDFNRGGHGCRKRHSVS
jgi:hypothetical protein